MVVHDQLQLLQLDVMSKGIIRKQTFKKSERLKSRKIISSLFENGKSFTLNPYRVVWKITTLESVTPAQVVISVSKKYFPRAVDRNLIKRRIREVYRKNKEIIYSTLQEKKTQCAFMIIYTEKKIMDFKTMETTLVDALKVFGGKV